MKPRFMVLFLVVAFLTSGLAFAQEQKRFGDHVPPGQKTAKVASQKLTAPGFGAVLLGDVYEPWGVGVTASGNQVYINSPWAFEILKYESGSISLLMATATRPAAGHYAQDLGLYWGDHEGSIFHHVLDTPILKTLAALGYDDPSYPAITALTVDPASTSVYFYDYFSQNLYRVPNFNGHTPKLITHLPIRVHGLAIKGNLIYITDSYGGRIYTMPKNGGKLTLLSSSLINPCGLAFDKNGNLFIADYSGSIFAIKRGTRTVQWIAGGFDAPFYIAVDGKGNVYFTDFWDGSLWMLARNIIL